jgi:hypothetical protein
MAKMGRPPTETAKIDKVELEKLMRMGVSEREVMDWFDVSLKTLVRYIKKEFDLTFVQMRDKSFIRTKIAIKRAQIEKALKGDNTMLIWVGKQYLGQRDKHENETELTVVASPMTPEQAREFVKKVESEC